MQHPVRTSLGCMQLKSEGESSLGQGENARPAGCFAMLGKVVKVGWRTACPALVSWHTAEIGAAKLQVTLRTGDVFLPSVLGWVR